MANTIVGPLGSLQVAEQTALGTPATQPALELMGEGVTLVPNEPQSRFDNVTGRGVAANDLDPVRTNNTAVLTHPQPLTAESLLQAMHACFGDVTPTTVGTNGRLWDWQFDPRSNMIQNYQTLWTVERNENATPDTFVTRIQDAFLQSMQITWDATADAVGTMTCTYMGNRMAEGVAYTAATGNQNFTPILPNMRVSFDDDWATMIGSTPTYESDVYSVDYNFTTGLVEVPRAHGDADYGYDEVSRSVRTLVTVTLGIYADATATGLYRTQRALKNAGTRQFVALHGTGGEIESGTDYEIHVGGCFTHTPDSLTNRLTHDANGRATMNIVLQSMFDDTATVNKNIYFRTQNAEQTYP